MTRSPISARIAARTITDPVTGCIVWQGYLYDKGYGQIWIARKKQRVHRVAYELANGPIADGLVLDHLCRNRACCNPKHLEAVTHRVNILRGEGASALAVAKTHCIRGHELNETNALIAKGRRQCRLCLKARRRVHRKSRAKGVQS